MRAEGAGRGRHAGEEDHREEQESRKGVGREEQEESQVSRRMKQGRQEEGDTGEQENTERGRK